MKKLYSVLIILILIPTLLFFLKSKPNQVVNSELATIPVSSIQGNADNPFAASEFRYNMLSSTKDSKNSDIDLQQLRRDAIEYTKENLTPENDNSGFGWFSIGPGNIGGRIRSIIIHPVTTSTILIGAVAGGVWKTTNGGTNWVEKLDTENPISIGSMTREISDPDIVYAGSGEGWLNGDAVYGGGIYKSTDFGDTWILLPSTIGASVTSFRNVLKMAVDPVGNIYAATRNFNVKHGIGTSSTAGGLFKSTNGGTNWTKISSTVFTTNYFRPTDLITLTSTEILYAVNSNGATLGGIYRTTNSGTNWTKMTVGLPTTDYRRIVLEQDPSHADTIYSTFQSTDVTPTGDAGLKGIFKSTDRGITWSAVPAPPKIVSTGLLSYLGTQGGYDNVLEIDPFDSKKIYAGGIDVMKTTNEGTNWSQLTFWDIFYGSPVVHADHHAIAFDPLTPGVVYSGNDGGVYKSTNAGISWTELNNDLAITQFYGGAVYKTGSTIYGGTQDNGQLKYSSGSDWSTVYGGDGGYSAVDQTDPLVAYEEYVYLTISKTTNGGANWFSATSGLTDAGLSSECLFIAPFAMSKDNSDVLIAGSNEMWLTTNGATTWTGVGPPLFTGEFVTAVTITGISAPFKGYAGTNFGSVLKCTTLDPSLGLSNVWADVTPVGNNTAFVRRIGINPLDPESFIACYSGFNFTGFLTSKHVWSTSTGGASWTDISFSLPNIPVHSVIFDPGDAMTLWIGTETGVYKTTDYGAVWFNYSPGMPTFVPVDELVLQEDTWSLFAFTHGRSVYVSDVPLPVELNSFASNVNGNNVRLSWMTSSETNNSGFDIERKSFNENNGWKKLSFIEGHGTSNNNNSYLYTDAGLNSGKYNYRLKQIDFNGNYKYYNLENEVVVGLPGSFYLSQNYPNPFNPETKIDFQIPFDSKVNLKIYDMTGKEIMNVLDKTVLAGFYSLKLNFSEFPSGAYFYRISADSEQKSFNESKRLLLIK